MEPVVMMSKEFKVALVKELNTVADVIAEYREGENNFDLEEYQRYHHELANLIRWAL